MLTSSINTTSGTSSTTGANKTSTETTQDRFLKLLVAQLNNQDPMNPMDNAAMTSQMAQLSTVSGIEQVNATLKSMSEQFNALQMMQTSNLVGRNVLVEGNTLVPVDGVAVGAIDLDKAASSVTVEILSPKGKVIDTIDAGALSSGRNYFSWDASKYTESGNPTFRVTATQGGKAVSSTSLSCDTVVSVGMDAGVTTLQLQGRESIAYGDIKAIL